MEYDKNSWYLTEDDIKYILLDQVRQVETMIFQHHLQKMSLRDFFLWKRKYLLKHEIKKNYIKAINY